MAGIRGGMAQRAAVRTGLRRGASIGSTRARGMRVREGWARARRAGVGKPSVARMAKPVSHERAQGMDARSERPARWHGPASSRCEVNPPHRPAVLGCWQTGGWLVVNADWAGWW